MHTKMHRKTGGASVYKSLQNVTHNAHIWKHWYIRNSVYINWHRRLHKQQFTLICCRERALIKTLIQHISKAKLYSITYLFVWWYASQLESGFRLTQHSLISLITKGDAKLYFDSNRNLFRSINELSELKIPILLNYGSKRIVFHTIILLRYEM